MMICGSKGNISISSALQKHTLYTHTHTQACMCMRTLMIHTKFMEKRGKERKCKRLEMSNAITGV